MFFIEMFQSLLVVSILLYFIIQLLVFFWLAIYCRIMKRKAKKNMFSVEHSIIEDNQFSNPISIFSRVYSSLYSYFYGLMRYSIVQVGKIPSFTIRRFMYKYVFCMEITKRTVIYGGCEIRSPWNIQANNCVISNNCLLDGRYGIKIGDNVVFGVGVHVWTAEHSINDPYFNSLPENCQPVIINDRAWICSDTTILPGVTIGEGAVIASKACLTRDAEPYGVYGGVPAKRISARNPNLVYVLDGKPTWRFY